MHAKEVNTGLVRSDLKTRLHGSWRYDVALRDSHDHIEGYSAIGGVDGNGHICCSNPHSRQESSRSAQGPMATLI